MALEQRDWRGWLRRKDGSGVEGGGKGTQRKRERGGEELMGLKVCGENR